MGAESNTADEQEISSIALDDRIGELGPKKDAMAAEVAQLLAAKLAAEQDVKAKAEALEASEYELARVSAACKAKKQTLDDIEREQRQLEEEAENDSARKCASLELWWQNSCANSSRLAANIKRKLEDFYIQELLEYKQEETERLHKLKRSS